MAFRDRLIATIRAARPVLAAEGILVVGSEVPNLLQPNAAATLVVSQDLDIGVSVDRHRELKPRLDELADFVPSSEEPSVWLPNLTILSLLQPRTGMPDPLARRADVAALLRRLEQAEPEGR